jgi:hypothetical protein
VLASSAVIPANRIGFLGSAVAGYFREMESERMRAARAAATSESQHVGIVGKRGEMVLTLTSLRALDNDFGVSYLCKFVDAAGNVISWFASRKPEMVEGGTYTVRATVKAHAEYRGTAETRLTRVNVLALAA